MNTKVRDEINHPFQLIYFNCEAAEICEWMINFIPHFNGLGLKRIHICKTGLRYSARQALECSSENHDSKGWLISRFTKCHLKQCRIFVRLCANTTGGFWTKCDDFQWPKYRNIFLAIYSVNRHNTTRVPRCDTMTLKPGHNHILIQFMGNYYLFSVTLSYTSSFTEYLSFKSSWNIFILSVFLNESFSHDDESHK